MKDIQKIYTVFDYHFDKIESSLLELEQSYYQLDMLYEKIEKNVAESKQAIQEKGETRLLRKMDSLAEKLYSAHEKKGYDHLFFQKFFELIKEIKKDAPSDLLNVPVGEPNKLQEKDFASFLAVQNGNLHFLVSCKQKKWQKKIVASKIKSARVKIQIPNFPKPNVFVFSSLGGTTAGGTTATSKNEKSDLKQKIAVLVETEQKKDYGFFADKIEEQIHLEKKLLKEKMAFLTLDSGEDKPYIYFKGERYFLIP